MSAEKKIAHIQAEKLHGLFRDHEIGYALQALASQARTTLNTTGGYYPSIWLVYEKHTFAMNLSPSAGESMVNAFTSASYIASATAASKVFCAYMTEDQDSGGDDYLSIAEAITHNDHRAIATPFFARPGVDVVNESAVIFGRQLSIDKKQADAQNPYMAKMFSKPDTKNMSDQLSRRCAAMVQHINKAVNNIEVTDQPPINGMGPGIQ